MKYIITERQLKLIKEQDEILEFDFYFFFNDWNILQDTINSFGNPPYILRGDVDLSISDIKTLGSLVGVDGSLDLRDSDIESLGNLQYVGSDLYLTDTPLSEKTTEEEIRNMPNLTINGEIYL